MKKTITTRDTLSETVAQGSTLSGNTTYVQAGNDIDVVGSNVVSTAGTTLIAKNDVRIEAARETADERHLRDVKKSGKLTLLSFVNLGLKSRASFPSIRNHTPVLLSTIRRI